MHKPFEDYLEAGQRQVWASLRSPSAIQDYLDALPYSVEPANRCPLRVLQDGQANCFDGALFAAAALRRLGYLPRLVDLWPAPNSDDEHIIAIYRRAGGLGALAKSNFVGLRWREPVYRSLRELVMSYFDFYYNVAGQKTLRAYSLPVALEPLDYLNWMVDDAALPAIFERLERRRRVPVLSAAMIAGLSPVDSLSYRAGLLAADRAGLYQPATASEVAAP